MTIDTVIFDLDGTLLNSLDGIYEAFNHALKKAGFETYSKEEVRSFAGSGIRRAYEKALAADVPDETFENIINDFKECYAKCMFEYSKPYEGIMEMLEELKKRGYKTAVLSNKYDAAVQELSKKFFGGLIDAALGESAEIRRKPYPDGMIKLIGLLGSKLDNVIYAGDSEVDIKTAENINAPCISVLWGFKDKAFLEKYGGKLFAETPADILKIITSEA